MEHFIFYRLITEMYCIPAQSQSDAQIKLYNADDLQEFACSQIYKEPSEMVFMSKCQSDICPRRRTNDVARRKN
jgi:hypothetical protein